jgi:hypothetical protein
MLHIYYKLLILFGLFFPFFAYAQEESLDQQITRWTVWIIVVVSVWVALLTLIAITKKEPSEAHKQELFWGISAPVILVTLFVAVSTVYLNIISETKGPVHWHADFRIFNCGYEIDLVDPTGLSNKIGSPLLHEHDDLRIHVEGTVHRMEDVSVGSFFKTIGGQASLNSLTLPTTEGLVTMQNNERCTGGLPEYEDKIAKIQVYLYKTEGNKVYQEKLVNWPEYIITPETIVPPGDCLIFEYSPEFKSQTDKICNFYAVELDKGNLEAVNFEYGN